MSVAVSYVGYRPQLRTDVVFGPPVLSRGATIHYVKDGFTGWFYRIGAREYFLASRMDGSRTLDEIASEYEAAFERKLDSRSWASLFKLLGARQLLADGVDQTVLLELKQEATRRRKREGNGFFHWRFKLVNPDAWLEKLLPWVRFAFHPVFVVSVILLILTLEVFVLLNGHTIVADVLASTDKRVAIPTYALFIVLFWPIAVLHETAHGLTCKRFGGSVSEMGIVWRYLSFFPFCKLDDIVLFHQRRHRVYAAFAGTFVSLFALLPFAVLWQVSPEKSVVRDLCALMLLIFNIQSLANLIPFIELDGYFMLSHAIDIIDLRRESQQFCLGWLRKFLFKKGGGTVGYGQRGWKIYLIYGILSLTFTCLFVAYMLFYWFTVIRPWLGNTVTLTLLTIIALLFLIEKGPGMAKILAWCKALLTKRAEIPEKG